MPVCRVNVCLLLLFYCLFSSLLLFLSDFKDVYILHSVVILILLWQINIVVVVVTVDTFDLQQVTVSMDVSKWRKWS